jgi:hypothetical protein
MFINYCTPLMDRSDPAYAPATTFSPADRKITRQWFNSRLKHAGCQLSEGGA